MLQPEGPSRVCSAVLPLLPVGGRAMGEEGRGDEGPRRRRPPERGRTLLDPSDRLSPVVELGDLDLTRVSDGEFRLDGGAMFGVVPRVKWEKPCPPDAQNRIRMGTNCLLVARGNDLVLIDTGIGDKHDAKFMDIYAMDPRAV